MKKKQGYRSRYVDGRRERTREFLWSIKSERGCATCGYNEHPACLDFHHKDPSTKRFSLIVSNCHSRKLDVVLAEIDKCVVLCANCHRLLHTKE